MTIARVEARMAEMEAISRQRPFTEAEITEYMKLVARWRAYTGSKARAA